jgi:hypothetical protein
MAAHTVPVSPFRSLGIDLHAIVLEQLSAPVLPRHRATAVHSDICERRGILTSGRSPIFSLQLIAVPAESAGASSGVADDESFTLLSGTNKSIRVWSTSTWQCVRVLQGHRDAVVSMISFTLPLLAPPPALVTKPSLYLASGSIDTTIIIRRTNDWTPLAVLTGHTKTVWCMAVYHHLLVSGCGEGSIRIWNSQSNWRCDSVEKDAHADTVRALVTVGDFLVSGSWDGNIKVWRFVPVEVDEEEAIVESVLMNETGIGTGQAVFSAAPADFAPVAAVHIPVAMALPVLTVATGIDADGEEDEGNTEDHDEEESDEENESDIDDIAGLAMAIPVNFDEEEEEDAEFEAGDDDEQGHEIENLPMAIPIESDDEEQFDDSEGTNHLIKPLFLDLNDYFDISFSC